MLNKKMLKTVNNLVEKLFQCEWLSCNEQNTVVCKNGCFLFFDEVQPPAERFEYKAGDIEGNKICNHPLIVSTAVSIPKASWHAEYEGVVISYGKIPAVFVDSYVDCTPSNKKIADDFIETINNLAKNAENLAIMAPTKFTASTIHVDTPNYVEIKTLDEMGEMTVLDRGNGKPYVLLKKVEGNFMAVPISMETKNNSYQWIVHPDFVAQKTQPPFFTEDELYQLREDTNGKFLNVYQCSTQDVEYKWSQGDELNTADKSIKNLIDLDLDDMQLHYLNIAYDNKLNLAALVKNNYDAVTLKWLIKFLLKGYNSDGIYTSLKDESLSVLYAMASAGFFINKYTNPDFTVEMIKNMHDQFLAGFSQREGMLTEQGYSRESIDAILKIASRGDGISHVMYKEPALKLYLRDYGVYMGEPIITDYLLKEGIIEGSVISASYDGMPPHIKEEIKRFIDCLGDTRIHGVPWKEYCGYDNIKKIIFREDMKLLVVTDKGYIKKGEDHVILKSDIITTKACITCINNKIIVED